MAAASQALTLANAEDRPYQQSIARACHGRNSLIVLPTGLGKTIICALVMRRHVDAGERVLVVAPTRPLAEQHARTFREQLPEADVRLVTGKNAPGDRGDLWSDAEIAVATPQVARNDLLSGRLDAQAWGLLVVDEAHRAVGNYAAVTVAEELHQAGAGILGATASPGSDAERIQSVCNNLAVEHIEARGEWDDDVAPYVNPVSVEWVRVALPNTLEAVAERLREAAGRHVGALRSMGLYASRFIKRSELLKLRRRLREDDESTGGTRARRALGHVASALKLLHGVKLVETQSTRAARSYLASLEDDHDDDQALQEARRHLESYMGEHPKMRRCASELESHLGRDDDARALVFVQTRETARVLAEALDDRSQLDVGLFVGQSGDDGMSQSEQLERIEAFREGEYNALVATSVGEEGLDIPSVGLVVFYEAISSAIRTIQRRGRTGRAGRGRVVVLMARGTSDESAYWSATKREKQMRDLIRSIQEDAKPAPEPSIRPNPSANPDADDAEDGPRVLVDHRELNGSMARLLRQEGIAMEPTTLPVGDLVLSNRVVVERKTARDFIQSMFDGRLMDQARALKRSFEAPVLVVEGDPFNVANQVRQEAISGAIAALSGSFGVPVLTVPDERRAATVVASMTRREHEGDSGPPKLRHGTGGRTLEERQRFVLEGLPRVSSTLSKRLLERFGTPGEVFTATEKELKKVQGIGPTTATAIREVLHEPTETPWRSGTSTSTRARGSTTPSGTGAERSAS